MCWRFNQTKFEWLVLFWDLAIVTRVDRAVGMGWLDLHLVLVAPPGVAKPFADQIEVGVLNTLWVPDGISKLFALHFALGHVELLLQEVNCSVLLRRCRDGPCVLAWLLVDGQQHGLLRTADLSFVQLLLSPCEALIWSVANFNFERVVVLGTCLVTELLCPLDHTRWNLVGLG